MTFENRSAAQTFVTHVRAAEILGVHPNTVSEMVGRGELSSRGRRQQPSLLRADVEQLARDRAVRAKRGVARRAARVGATRRVQPPDTDHTWRTVTEAAASLGVSQQVVRRWCSDGRLPASRIAKLWWIRAESLDAMRRSR